MWSTWMFDVSSDDLYGIYACIDWSVINVMEGFIQNWKYTALVNKKTAGFFMLALDVQKDVEGGGTARTLNQEDRLILPVEHRVSSRSSKGG